MSKTWRDLLIVDSLINKGTYKTPVIVKVLAGSGSVENPSITIGEEEIKYNGTIKENGLLKIDTDKMTVVLRQPEIALSPTFSRDSTAYQEDGSEVAADTPRFEQGKFDKAVLVEEGTRNICTNPSFETDLTGWTHMGGGTSSRVTNQRYYGNACLKISTTDTENAAERWYAVANPGNYAGKTVSFSCMVKTSIADKLILSIREYDGNTFKWSISSPHPGDGTWKKLSVTTTLRSTVTNLQLQLSATAGIIGDFWCDGVLFEEKPYPTSFTPGTRSPETLTIPTAGVLNPQRGEVAILRRMDIASNNPPSGVHRNIFSLKGVVWGIFVPNGMANIISWAVGGWGSTINVNITWDAGDWLWIFAEWDLPHATLHVYNVTKGTHASATITNAVSVTVPSSAYVGCADGVLFNAHCNGLIDDLRISSRARTDEEIAAWHNGGEPIPVGEHTTYLLRFDNNLIALQSKTTNTLANYEGSFPKLSPGETSVSVSTLSGTPTVTFKWHDRWV